MWAIRSRLLRRVEQEIMPCALRSVNESWCRSHKILPATRECITRRTGFRAVFLLVRLTSHLQVDAEEGYSPWNTLLKSNDDFPHDGEKSAWSSTASIPRIVRWGTARDNRDSPTITCLLFSGWINDTISPVSAKTIGLNAPLVMIYIIFLNT